MGCSICLSVVVWTKISAPTIAYSLSGLRCTCLLTYGTILYMGKNVRFVLSLLSDGHTDALRRLSLDYTVRIISLYGNTGNIIVKLKAFLLLI
jgi:hypothetical protein